jgi:hypothetical protein
MENKRHLKIFSSQSDYESQKDAVMGMPHVALFDDTKELLYASEEETPSVDYSKEYFTIESLEDDNKITFFINPLLYNTCNIYYSINDNDFKKLVLEDFDNDGIIGVKDIIHYTNHGLILNKNDKMRIKIDNYEFFKNKEDVDENNEIILIKTNIFGETDNIINATKNFNCYGNIMSLLYGDNFTNNNFQELMEYTTIFYRLFNNTTVVNAKYLILPNFITEGCYQHMFRNCTSLTTAPELPATTLANYCYQNMFNGCSKLSNITMLATNISASGCLNNWVKGISSSGTFIKHPDMDSLSSGSSGIPEGWTVVDYSND